MSYILISHTDEDDNSVGDATGKFEHPRPAGGDVNGNLVFAGVKQVNLAGFELHFFAGQEIPHLLYRFFKERQFCRLHTHGLDGAVAQADADDHSSGRVFFERRIGAGNHRRMAC